METIDDAPCCHATLILPGSPIYFTNSNDDTSPLHEESQQDMNSILHSPKSTKDRAGHAMVKAAPAVLGLLARHSGHSNRPLSHDSGRKRIIAVLE